MTNYWIKVISRKHLILTTLYLQGVRGLCIPEDYRKYDLPSPHRYKNTQLSLVRHSRTFWYNTFSQVHYSQPLRKQHFQHSQPSQIQYIKPAQVQHSLPSRIQYTGKILPASTASRLPALTGTILLVLKGKTLTVFTGTILLAHTSTII